MNGPESERGDTKCSLPGVEDCPLQMKRTKQRQIKVIKVILN